MGRGYGAVLGAVLGALPALAQEPAAEVRSLSEVQGPITAVDERGGVLTLAHSGGRVQLHVDGATTIFLPGRTGSLGDLRTGQRVRVTYEPQESGPVAQWIELLEPEPRPP